MPKVDFPWIRIMTSQPHWIHTVDHNANNYYMHSIKHLIPLMTIVYDFARFVLFAQNLTRLSFHYSGLYFC
jgi:hypothetical protein